MAGDAGIITDWVARASAEPDARRRADLGGLALVFAEAAGCRDAWKNALKEWNMIQSKQVQEWQDQARAQTRTETRVEDLLGVLRERVGALPESLIEEIRGQRDPDVLWRWLTVAARSMTVDEFLRDIATQKNGT